jgi:hypothetical protein
MRFFTDASTRGEFHHGQFGFAIGVLEASDNLTAIAMYRTDGLRPDRISCLVGDGFATMASRS